MYIFGKRADQLTAEDIKRLVDNKVQESKSLDYKKELKFSQDKDRKEFLFDITSMFNTDGGCLIYGIEESKDDKGQNTGTPETITGIVIENYDKLVQQIEDTVKGNSEPSITNLALNKITVDEQTVLVIGISRGLGLPAMVTFNETNKFFRRRNSGKYAVDVYELNQMFMQNQVLRESAEKFRLHRIEKVRNLKVFPTLDNFSSYFIQIIPFSFINEQTLDLSNAENMQLASSMKPMYSGSWDIMYNLDGYASFSISSDRQKIDSYDQILRNGAYEVYTSRMFEQKNIGGKMVKCIYGFSFIKQTLEKVSDTLNVLKKFQIEPPFIVCLSIHNILNGVIIGEREVSRPFFTDEIILPPIILPTYETNLHKQLKTNFDILWQSAGYSESPSN